MECVIFPNDINEILVLPDGFRQNQNMRKRPFHESIFRLIVSILNQEKIINGNIIDLGAWIGDNSVVWAKNINPRKVYAIDPSDDNCRYIRQIKDINNIENLDVIQTAISNKNETISTNDDIGHATFQQNNSGKNILNAVTLDYLNEKKTIKDVDFIHLDAEGMEYQVLQGAESIIDKNRPIIVYEVHLNTDKHINDIKELLKSKGYNVYIINEILPGCNFDCRNCLAVPKEKDTELTKMLEEKLNGNYRFLVHIGDRIADTIISDLHTALKTFTLFKGGDYACILIENGPGGKIIKKYGDDSCCNTCYNFSLKNIGIIVNLFSQR